MLTLPLQAYLVIRTKRGESQQKRLKTLVQSPVFRLHHGTDSFRQVSQIGIVFQQQQLCKPEVIQRRHISVLFLLP